MCPITVMPEGSEVTVARVAGGGEASKRLSELGLVPGVQVSVVQNGGGPPLFQGGGSRVALRPGGGPTGFVGGGGR